VIKNKIPLNPEEWLGHNSGRFQGYRFFVPIPTVVTGERFLRNDKSSLINAAKHSQIFESS
jgi:hypothetical protein